MCLGTLKGIPVGTIISHMVSQKQNKTKKKKKPKGKKKRGKKKKKKNQRSLRCFGPVQERRKSTLEDTTYLRRAGKP